MKKKILEKFGKSKISKSALNLGNAEAVFRELLEGKGYKTILEIGTYKGATAAVLSQYCDRVVTIDLKDGRLEQTDPAHDRKEMWKGLGIKNIQLKLIKDDEDKKRFVGNLDFDFVFIDGDHSFDGVARDFELSKRCGRVLFHDYDFTGRPGKDDVWNFVNTLDKNKIRVLDNIFAYYEDM